MQKVKNDNDSGCKDVAQNCKEVHDFCTAQEHKDLAEVYCRLSCGYCTV